MASPDRQDSEGMGAPHASVALLREVTDFATPDGKTVHLSEYDLAVYDRHDNTSTLSRNIMMRAFGAVDVEGAGKISAERLPDLAKYLCLPTEDKDDPRNILAVFPGGATFDDFFAWWNSLDEVEAHGAFSLMSASFTEPFHQHQLLTKCEGEQGTLNWRCKFFLRDLETNVTVPASPWHDIPLYVKTLVKTTPESDVFPLVHFVCEIPRYTRAKYEISRTEAFNPIKQDVKHGCPRFYRHGDMMFNYGAAPQTYEHAEIGFNLDGKHYKGDNDPLDFIEIGVKQLQTGTVTAVKVLGVLGMIDDGEMDWKVVCVASDDPLASAMNDIDDVDKIQPGALDSLREWLRAYKIVDNQPANEFSHGEKYLDRAYTHKLIAESHRMWRNIAQLQGQRELSR